MALKEPQSMDECIYFTKRTIGYGKVKAWVFKEQCQKCKKSILGKPVEKGKVKIRAKEYVCPECKYTVEKKQYEESLTCNVQYVCPACSYSGETQVPFKRKNIQGVPTIQVECEKCHVKINITKKMKASGESKLTAGEGEEEGE
ncbi:hypothetical protein HY484_03005 [Candidatus Woesearchaeota archaeon]|nr:hypothetical protein [Candidatus Woesearchaeota archaeon]